MDQFDIFSLYCTAIDSFKDKKLPSFISEHPVIKSTKAPFKIFPKVGLSNFTIPIKVSPKVAAQEKLPLLKRLADDFSEIFYAAGDRLQRQFAQSDAMSQNTQRLSSHADVVKENAHFAAIKAIYDKFQTELLNFVNISQSFMDSPPVDESGKIILLLPSGEKFFKAYQKLQTRLFEFAKLLGSQDSTLPFLDDIPVVKIFNQQNIPLSSLSITFASHDDGLYDIATMSERGISSCQSWNAETGYNTCLIGSILSKFVGIIYLSSNSSYNDLGTKMIKRCIVRYGINTHTSSPAIVLDKMYPLPDHTIAKLFVQALEERSSIQVIDFSSGANDIPDDFIIKTPKESLPIENHELSYQDTLRTQKDIDDKNDQKAFHANKTLTRDTYKSILAQIPQVISSIKTPENEKAIGHLESILYSSLNETYDRFFESFDPPEPKQFKSNFIRFLYKRFIKIVSSKFESTSPAFKDVYKRINTFLLQELSKSIREE